MREQESTPFFFKMHELTLKSIRYLSVCEHSWSVIYLEFDFS